MTVKLALVHTEDRLVNQLQTNVMAALRALFSITAGTFTVSLLGCATAPLAVAKWQIAASTGQVTLSIPALTATSNAAFCVLSGLPTQIWPATTQTVLLVTTNNAVTSVLPAQVLATGTIQLLADFTTSGATNFVTTGTKGVGACNVTYLVGS